MAKRLVICCDGTWNTPDQMRDGQPTPTNVAKVALSVASRDGAGQEQRTFYHCGVGTRRWDRIRGGVFGFGLSRDVRDTYRFVVENYEPGDELFFFGFSRGAYTARSTVGFIRNCGILRRDQVGRIGEAYALYRGRASRSRPRSIESQLFRRSHSFETRIRFVGVWDTVGALGIPLSGLRLINVLNRRWQFHDTTLSSTVDAAFHALAIDEYRGPFRPAVWSQSDQAEGQRLEQVWLSGAHSDIGGGYPDPALSEIALLWMVDRARSCGLVFEPEAFRQLEPGADALRHTGRYVAPDALGGLHDSRTGFYRLLRRHRRELGAVDAVHEYVASSAVERRDAMPGYAPAHLTSYLDNSPQVLPVPMRGLEPLVPAGLVTAAEIGHLMEAG